MGKKGERGCAVLDGTFEDETCRLRIERELMSLECLIDPLR